MSHAKKNQKNLEKEDLLQAVVVADDFLGTFAGFTEDCCSALIPVANFCVIDYSLECLTRCGFQETILFCSSHAQAIKDHIKKSQWSQASSTMNVTILVSEKCQSLGDAIRDIDNKALIKGDFVLLSALTVTNLNLLDILKHHRVTSARDKGAAMTLVLQDVGARMPKLDEFIYVVYSDTNRLLMHYKSSKLDKFKIPMEHLAESVNLHIYSNLIDTGVAVCSPSVPLLFSDNFDFQTKGDFIRGLLLNEGILDSRIYCYQVENGYGATIKNWQTFQRVNIDCIRRWTYPLVPDQSFTSQDSFSFYRNCIYKQSGVQTLDDVKLEMDVIIGKNSHIDKNTRLVRSVLGKNCKIGKNVVIRDSYILDNCIIENNCKVELSIVGECSRVKENSELKNCFLKRKVVVNPKSHLEEIIMVSEPLGKNWNEHNKNAFFQKIRNPKLDSDEDLSSEEIPQSCFIDPENTYFKKEEDDDSCSEFDSEQSHSHSPEQDDTTLFYIEVVDSLHRGFEEKLSCENLILEINSSRYAYNVMLSDVSVLTLKGILLLPSRVGSNTKVVLSYFLPLLKNYIKSSSQQLECLRLLEDLCNELNNDLAHCLHFLYDKDIISENNILKWHDEIDKDSPVLNRIASFIKWLKEADEESSSEEESE